MQSNRGATLAEALAAELGGSASELASEREGLTHVVSLADGRVPVLVFDFGHLVRVHVWRSNTWAVRPADIGPDTIREVVATTRTWMRSRTPDRVTLFELAQILAARLSEALAQRWLVHLPGGGEPSSATLHGPDFDAASVVVGDDGTNAFAVIGQDRRPIEQREQLELVWPQVLASVREQLAGYRANLAISEGVRELADLLVAELAARLGLACTVTPWSRPSHWRALELTIRAGEAELVRIHVPDDGPSASEIRVHAGVVGADGWDGSGAEAAARVEQIVAAIERARVTLTRDRLTPGASYRVRESIQELQVGMIVRFVHFDDIDNHYGCYVFSAPDGRTLTVCGDDSTPRNSPLAETHRYLEPVAG